MICRVEGHSGRECELAYVSGALKAGKVQRYAIAEEVQPFFYADPDRT